MMTCPPAARFIRSALENSPSIFVPRIWSACGNFLVYSHIPIHRVCELYILGHYDIIHWTIMMGQQTRLRLCFSIINLGWKLDGRVMGCAKNWPCPQTWGCGWTDWKKVKAKWALERCSVRAIYIMLGLLKTLIDVCSCLRRRVRRDVAA